MIVVAIAGVFDVRCGLGLFGVAVCFFYFSWVEEGERGWGQVEKALWSTVGGIEKWNLRIRVGLGIIGERCGGGPLVVIS